MKTAYYYFITAVFVCLAFFACKKYMKDGAIPSDQNLKDAKARAALACTFETLSGNITANRTLTATTTYKLDGCVTVKNGVTLAIPAGTVLLGMKTPTGGGKSALIVEQGGILNISGTSSSPVVFTSDQAPGSRLPGDWVGLRIFGNANNNNSNSLSIDLGCATYTGGGTVNSDNSGTMQYFQVHFAGAAASAADFSKAAVMLNSVGTGTTFDHVQISNPLNDGFAAFGGMVKLGNIASYNAHTTDFRYEFGYRGNSQFLSALRLNNAAIPPGASYGLEITNNRFNPPATPLTQPVISNLSIQGPNYCNSTAPSTNFQYAIRISGNGAGKIYNSMLSSWNTSAAQAGLHIEGSSAIANTASNNLEFSYNSFHNSGGTPYSTDVAWSTGPGCGTTMAAWITGAPTAPACKETGNQFSVATLGYDPTFCNSFCSGTFSQNFVLGTTTLSAANFGWDTGGAFSHPTYRGAYGATDWTKTWTDWCPGNRIYCQ